MKYEKPQLASLGSASSVVQGSKMQASTSDGTTGYHTVNAYEADE